MIKNDNVQSRTLKNSFVNNYNQPSSNIINNDNLLDDNNDDIINKVINKIIFKDIRFIFNPNVEENFENNIKFLKQNYEDRIDSLDRNMEYYKSYLENYYRKKIQKTKSNFMDNIEMLSDNLPIMNITSEHNDKLRILRELYDEKIKELEHVK